MINLMLTDHKEIEKIGKDRQKISEIRDGIRQKFSEFFGSQRYSRHKPSGIIPGYDKSVLFTGSTISTFKPYLKEKYNLDNGFYIIQSCLRTQNVKTLKNDSEHPQWISYFSSIGALAKYEELDVLSQQVWEFYTCFLGIPENRLRIRIASKDSDLLRYWKHARLDKYLELNINSSNYYTHKFGIEGVTGRNCNLAIVDSRTGNLHDIGNIIVIEKKDMKLGVEIAFGIETITSRVLGLPSAIAASLIADIIPIRNKYSLKLADAISASVVILDTGERPIATNRGRVLRSYLQAISYLRKKVDANMSEIKAYTEEFEQREFGSISYIPEKICEYLINFEKLTESGLPVEKINERISGIFQNTLQKNIHMARQPLSSYYSGGDNNRSA